MSFSATCRAIAPDILCRHSDILLYLAPVAALAVVIRILAATHPFFFLFTLAGTICHELAHVLVGFLTGARPGAITVIPKRKGKHWELGSVTLNRLRWYNAIPSALAPLLIVLIPLGVAWWRTSSPAWHFEPLDVLLAFALAPQLLSFLPSKDDWRIARHGWPLLVIVAVVAWSAWHFWPKASFPALI